MSLDPQLQNPCYHGHSLGGLSFCSGSYGRVTLDLTGDVIAQVVKYRNDMQDLLEVVNPSSWGTNLHGIASSMRSAYNKSNSSVYMTKKQEDAENKKIASGEQDPLDSASGRGMGDVWQLTGREMEEARRARA